MLKSFGTIRDDRKKLDRLFLDALNSMQMSDGAPQFGRVLREYFSPYLQFPGQVRHCTPIHIGETDNITGLKEQ